MKLDFDGTVLWPCIYLFLLTAIKRQKYILIYFLSNFKE